MPLGVSLDDDCITISMGFRAPSYVSLAAAYVEWVSLHLLPSNDMFSDADYTTAQKHPGQVSFQAIESTRHSLKEKVTCTN